MIDILTTTAILLSMKLTGTASTTNIGYKRLGAMRNNEYFISDNPLPWIQAQEACAFNLPPSGKLVCIESYEELQVLWKHFEMSDDVYSSLWLGGRVNLNNEKFYWCDKTEFQDWISWGPGEPRFITNGTSVSMSFAGGLEFHTNMETLSKQFICELDLDAVLPTQ